MGGTHTGCFRRGSLFQALFVHNNELILGGLPGGGVFQLASHPRKTRSQQGRSEPQRQCIYVLRRQRVTFQVNPGCQGSEQSREGRPHVGATSSCCFEHMPAEATRTSERLLANTTIHRTENNRYYFFPANNSIVEISGLQTTG